MPWSGWSDAERSDGESDSVKDVDINIKTNEDGDITDVLVSDADGSKDDHDHFYEVDQGESGAVERVDWSDEPESETENS